MLQFLVLFGPINRIKLKRQVLYQDYNHGGLRAPNISVFCKALRLAWIRNLLFSEGDEIETWETVPDFFCKNYGGLNFLLRCNYGNKLWKNSKIPIYYAEILDFFRELKVLYGNDNGCDKVLFNNNDIIIDGKPFFFYQRMVWKRYYIHTWHTLDDNGKFLKFENFSQKYKVKCNFLSYLQVISAIPKHFLGKARQQAVDQSGFSHDTTEFWISPAIVFDLAKFKCKDYYWMFIRKTTSDALSPKKWKII